ncbi:serine hydrolase [Streptomyces xanthophaeus]|uniref:serine hydrolase n=1 Tax=Streptomyces xanthophaeus TaxID=67385 RepID=UPI00264986CD|nr:serine hydrolase [Streptomyces xanthophaeus]WKD30784.1 serine hydrolase [Streptomyces xanthophaeus]
MTSLCDQATAVRALVESTDPGAVWAVGGPEGPHAGSDGEHPADAAFDVDGLAAVLVLWPVIGSLVDEGALRLHTPLAAYGDTAAEGVPAGTTAHHLLTHPGGTAALIYLARLAEQLSGSPLADLAATRVWHPLGMTGTHFADGTLRAPLADLVRFLCRLLDPAEPSAPAGISRAWTTESLRIRTGELTPARGLLWDPASHGVWTHHAPQDGGAALWISPRHRCWAVLLPTAGRGTPRTAFREAAFASTTPE